MPALHRLRIATRIHYALRRRLGTRIDVGQMLRDAGYARETLHVCLGSNDTELKALAWQFMLGPTEDGSAAESGSELSPSLPASAWLDQMDPPVAAAPRVPAADARATFAARAAAVPPVAGPTVRGPLARIGVPGGRTGVHAWPSAPLPAIGRTPTRVAAPADTAPAPKATALARRGWRLASDWWRQAGPATR